MCAVSRADAGSTHWPGWPSPRIVNSCPGFVYATSLHTNGPPRFSLAGLLIDCAVLKPNAVQTEIALNGPAQHGCGNLAAHEVVDARNRADRIAEARPASFQYLGDLDSDLAGITTPSRNVRIAHAKHVLHPWPVGAVARRRCRRCVRRLGSCLFPWSRLRLALVAITPRSRTLLSWGTKGDSHGHRVMDVALDSS